MKLSMVFFSISARKKIDYKYVAIIEKRTIEQIEYETGLLKSESCFDNNEERKSLESFT